MKKFKSLLCTILALCIVFPAMILLSACGKTQGATSTRTLSLSVNPEIIFVVDKDNKVTSISYGNSEDAGKIYANVDFENMDISEAIKVFIEKATISGHVGLDNSQVNDVVVKVSGSVEADIESLKTLAKSKVQETFRTFGVEAGVVISDLTETQMKNGLVLSAKALYPERTESELQDMTNAELIDLINAKQKEYKNLTYNQINEIKNEIQAELADAQSTLASLKVAINAARISFEAAENALKSAEQAGVNIDALKAQLESAKSNFENALNAFTNQEKIFIDAKKAQASEAKQELLSQFKSKVSLAKNSVVSHLDIAKQEGRISDAQYNYWIELINENKADT